MVLGSINDLHDDYAAPIGTRYAGASQLGDIDGGEGGGALVGGNGGSVDVNLVCDILGGGATVLDVVFNSEIFIGPTRVVAGGEDESSEGLDKMDFFKEYRLGKVGSIRVMNHRNCGLA